MSELLPEVTPFRYGDVCEYIGDNKIFDGIHLIQEVFHLGEERFEYVTTLGAWVPHKDLKLIQESNRKSRNEIFYLEEEEEDA